MTKSTPHNDRPEGKERIAKVMARAGLCSRRDAERWIAEARVELNGSLVTTPATLVEPGDSVKVDGKLINADTETLLWRYYKPDGLVTSHKDPEGRETVFDNLPPFLPRVVSVGRLDLTSEGLLLLTNDGALARFLEHPATGWLRRYRVRAYGRVTKEQLDSLADGVTVDGVRYGPIEAVLDRVSGGNIWLTVGISEGKNREVRRVLSHLGLTVNRLIRMSYGPFQVGRLKPGDVEQVPRRVLFDQLGLKKGDDLGKFLNDQNKVTREVPEVDSATPIAAPTVTEAPAMTDDDDKQADEIVVKPRQAKKILPKREKIRHVKAGSVYERRALRRNRKEEAQEVEEGRDRHSRYRDHRDPPKQRNPRPDGDRRDDRSRDDGDRGDRKRFDRDGDRRDRKRFDGDRPRGDRSRSDRPYGRSRDGDERGGDRRDRKRFDGDRPRGDRSRSDRPYGRSRDGDERGGDRSDRKRFDGDRPRGDRSRSDRPYGRSRDGDERGGDRRDRKRDGGGFKGRGGKPGFKGRSSGDSRDGRGARDGDSRPARGRPSGGRPSGGRPSGNRSGGGRPSGGRPSGNRSGGGRPSGGRGPGKGSRGK